MADYIYLLETRLSPAQQRAIGTVRTVARENDVTIFLTGGAVRDLTGGGSVRDLDLTIQGDVSRLKPAIEAAGGEVYGEHPAAQKLFLVLPGGVRIELSSTVNVSYPQPGKPKYETGTLSDDLRSRDFTANAMAISLNDGSYGLLIDPLNGVADIENRELRLVSNYGFIEDPSRLIRATRLSSRLGWQMEERTRQRYETAKEEGYISSLAAWNRGYELEEIFHEEDPVRILRALEAEGWMTTLFPALSSTKANTAALADVAERQGQLQTHGILAHSAALLFPLITAKLPSADVAALKAALVRPGFVSEIESLEGRTREFGTRFASKEAGTPSAAWKILHDTEPNLVLSMAYSSKAASVQSRLKTFLTESPLARQRVPYALMQEMRITPDLPGYADLLEKLFFELMDGNLSTTEEMKAYLEPYSPPAPPPPISLRRARAKKEARPSRAKVKKAVDAPAAPMTVAAEEEAKGVPSGLTNASSLTGPDRGPEPTSHVPLEGKVAPEPVAVDPKQGTRKPAPAPSKPSVATAKPDTSKEAPPIPAAEKRKTPGKETGTARGSGKDSHATTHVQKSEPPDARKGKASIAVTSAPVKSPAKASATTTSKQAQVAAPAGKTSTSGKKGVPVKTAPAKAAPATKKAAPARTATALKKTVSAKKAVKATSAKPVLAKVGKSSSGAKKVAGKKVSAKKTGRRR